jgi:beta-mannosidase
LESHAFYRACDEMGLLVWQEFPLSSSGLDNWPPEDPDAVEQMAAIVESYVVRRCHHASLLLWCGGNELQGGPDGEKAGVGRPIDETHPMIARMAEVVATRDPGRRFLPTSSSGPRFDADPAEFGHGVHHDVHGPWSLPGGTLESARRYWEQDDSLFRSEVGAPGAGPEDLIEEYSGGLPTMPASAENPLWRRSSWWIEWDEFLASCGSDAGDPSLSEFVAWSASRQARALELAARSVKRRFPRAGGFIVWMGHDSFPCTANTAVLDFYGRMKPAARALAEVFHTPSEKL